MRYYVSATEEKVAIISPCGESNIGVRTLVVWFEKINASERVITVLQLLEYTCNLLSNCNTSAKNKFLKKSYNIPSAQMSYKTCSPFKSWLI